MKKLTTPLDEKTVRSLKAGDQILLSGVIWTGRDQAHKRLVALLDEGKDLPVDLQDQAIYFVGPCPARPGEPIGSAGPTTSGRMDAYSPRLIKDCKLRGMIGKGGRSDAVVDAMKQYGAVYFAAAGGAGALIAQSIKKAEVIAFPDLGPEAIHRLEVEDLPLVVAIDSDGNDLYKR
ncbi:MAG: Fe-S-containing hydro-lyase [Lentisphaeria bacterium]|nr:Fe-S-containing hydro-lyase [Lentisphaeria bacterium]MBQ7393567.1 Fe-S-containing hydro-lyase [Lentisphaeria bacterium]